jgi:hypothetical protein
VCVQENRIPAAKLALRSSGTGDADWTLTRNGYIGTFVHRESPGQIEVVIRARGGGASPPHLNIVVNDTKFGFDVGRQLTT